MTQQDVIEILAIDLIGVIPEDMEIVVSTNRGLPLTQGQGSIAGAAFKRVAQRLEGQEVPIPEFKSENWFEQLVNKLFNWG